MRADALGLTGIPEISTDFWPKNASQVESSSWKNLEKLECEQLQEVIFLFEVCVCVCVWRRLLELCADD